MMLLVWLALGWIGTSLLAGWAAARWFRWIAKDPR